MAAILFGEFDGFIPSEGIVNEEVVGATSLEAAFGEFLFFSC